MKRAAVVFLLAGTTLAAVLIARSEWTDIARAFATLGFGGLAVLVAAHLCLIGVMGAAWGALGWHRFPLRLFVWARLLRDGAAEVLPLSQIGGFVLGARALVLAGVPQGFASASTVVDVTLELLSQLLYTMLGLSLLAWLRPHSAIELPALAAVGAMAVLAGLFVVAQKRGLGAAERAFAGLTSLLLGNRPAGADTLSTNVASLHSRPGPLLAGTLLHLIAWISVGAETWIILQLIEAPVSLAAALVIDSLLSGLRSMAFMVPQALGVQEGGYVLLGSLFGLSPEQALALSLIRRVRDLTIGAPALLAWQAIEGRRVFRS